MRRLFDRFIKRHIVDDAPAYVDERPALPRLPVLVRVQIEPTWYEGVVVKHTLALKFQVAGGGFYDLIIGSSSDGAKMEEMARDIREELGMVE